MPAPKGNQNAKGNPGGGRPSSYKSIYAEQARMACEAGFTDLEISKLFGVSEHTINAWKLEHIEFCSALKVGKAPADDRVVRSLYNRAVGYSYEAVKIFMPAGAKEPVYAPYIEHVPPDVTAGIYWTKNRLRAEWRDKPDDAPQDGTLRIIVTGGFPLPDTDTGDNENNRG